MINDFLDKVFMPSIHTLGIFWFVVIISLVISFLVVIIYKWTTNQKLMKQIKDDMKTLQNKIKTLTQSNPEKAMKLQQEAMKKNMVYMKHSFKPTLYTLIPLLLLFGWLNATLMYVPIGTNETFQVNAYFSHQDGQSVSIDVPEYFTIIGNQTQQIMDDKASWKIRSTENGMYDLNFNLNNQTCTKKMLITDQLKTAPKKEFCKKPFKYAEIEYEKLKPAGENFSLLGWHPGWLGWYIILSILASMLFRKILKVY